MWIRILTHVPHGVIQLLHKVFFSSGLVILAEVKGDELSPVNCVISFIERLKWVSIVTHGSPSSLERDHIYQ